MSLLKSKLKKVEAPVLSNRQPPYSIAGGVHDALVDTRGEVYKITNQEVREAGQLFLLSEGIDIRSAAAVAVASVIKAHQWGKISHDDKVLLNITGGGMAKIKRDFSLHYLKPDIIVDHPDINTDDIALSL